MNWFSRNLLRIPIPLDRSDSVIQQITELGERLCALDQEILSAASALDPFRTEEASERLAVLVRADAAGIVLPPTEALVALPEDTELLVWLRDDNIFVGRAEQGEEFAAVIRVSDPDLRLWISEELLRQIQGGAQPSLTGLKNMRVPSDVSEANRVAARARDMAPLGDIIDTTRELDRVVTVACNLPEALADYVLEEMQDDAFLKRCRPAYHHLLQG